MDTLKEKIVNNSIYICIIVIIFAFMVINTGEASFHDDSWQEKYELMNAKDLRKSASKLLFAYQRQDKAYLWDNLNTDNYNEFIIDTSNSDVLSDILINSFDGLNKKAKQDIWKTIKKLYSERIESYYILNSHIRDNTGTVSARINIKEDPSIIAAYDISGIIAKYTKKHQQELMELYKESNKNESVVLQKISNGIYRTVLDKLIAEYDKEDYSKIYISLVFDSDYKLMEIKYPKADEVEILKNANLNFLN